MTAEDSEKGEIRETLIAANVGAARAEQLARLDLLIQNNACHAEYAARLLDQQAALAWQGDRREASRPVSGIVRSPGRGTRDRALRTGFPNLRSFAAAPTWSTVSVVTAFLLGGLLATIWSYSRRGTDAPHQLAINDAPHAGATANCGARLVRSTACLWEQDPSGSPVLGGWLAGGESLHLVEGLAEFNFSWSMGGSATLALEGPAAMMLGAEGLPTLRFGRLTATINARERPFILETPVGRLVLNDYGSIGVSAFGNDAEIHVFDGSASLESAWPSSASRRPTPLTIAAREALRITADSNGEQMVERHPAEKSYFVVQVSMASDALVVPAAYVSTVKAAKPIGYWRMERDAWPEVPNEMESRFGCRVVGSIARSGHPGNQAVEFGVTDQGGEIISNEVLDDAIRDSYSVEVWIKPSHYHMGALVSLIGQPETPAGVIPHAMLLELGGSGAVPTALRHPGRIRYLHRSPASDDTLLGTSCYSSASYTLRKWQHLVAVKDGAAMRLYINGELAGEGKDTSELPRDLRLLVGRLYPERQTRPFKGQLDELALYNRALSGEEIRSHFQLIRPEVPPVKQAALSKPAI